MANNIGEWSEIYVLFKLLGDKVLHPGDGDLKRLHNVFYPILKILRTEKRGIFEFSLNDDIVIISGQDEPLRIPVHKFQTMATFLLQEMKSSPGSTFSIPDIEVFMESVNCFSVKAKSSVKTDITIVIHDSRTGLTPTLGFSIKSQLGDPSTLLNASLPTTFVFEVIGLNISDAEIEEINKITGYKKIQKRVEEIYNNGGHLNFLKLARSIFKNNLVLIDSSLPQILSHLVFKYYSGENSIIKRTVKTLQQENPLGYDVSDNHEFYSYKIKKFLTEVALGMLPGTKWDGQYDATGGYLVVKEDGDILCYHIYNKNEFEDYLFNNTKLDTGSSGRNKFGVIYKEGQRLMFNLNLQIRFLK